MQNIIVYCLHEEKDSKRFQDSNFKRRTVQNISIKHLDVLWKFLILIVNSILLFMFESNIKMSQDFR